MSVPEAMRQRQRDIRLLRKETEEPPEKFSRYEPFVRRNVTGIFLWPVCIIYEYEITASRRMQKSVWQ